MRRRDFLGCAAALTAAALLPQGIVPPAAVGQPEMDQVRQARKSTSSQVVDPADHSAVGDGTTDDTAALLAAIAALTPGTTLWLGPDKTYRHVAELDITTKGVTVTGGGTLKATNYDSMAVYADADDIVIDGITFMFDTTGVSRQNAARHQRLSIWECDGVTLRNCTVDGSGAGGIFMHGATNFTIENPQVSNTLADGIHVTAASHHGRIVNPVTRHTGDDGVAVVSYQASGDPNFGLCHDIEVVSPHVIDSYVARGVSVVGGQNITYKNVTVEGSSSAGVYIAVEPSFTTYGCDNILIDGAMVKDANTLNTGRPNQGAVFLASDRGGFAITNTTVRNVTALNTDTAATAQCALVLQNGGTASNVLIEGVTADGTRPDLMFYSTAPSTSYTLVGVKHM